MANQVERGQCSLEVVVILLVLFTILAFVEYLAAEGPQQIRSVQLSGAHR